MGNFLVVVARNPLREGAARVFHAGIDAAARLGFGPPTGTMENDWALAASFARQNGSGSPVAVDPATGSWLISVGTWFHADGYGSGDEPRLLRRYLDAGAHRLAAEMEGFYVLVVGDARTRETVVITDIVGSCHGFVRMWEGGVALSGSSLLLAALGPRRLDPVGLQEFLYSGVVYEDRTLFAEVRKLGSARVHVFDGGGHRASDPWWRISDLTPDSLSGFAAVDALAASLIAAASNVARLFQRPVCDLTGGYDSRAVVAAFLSAGVPFSVTVSGPGDSPDARISLALATLAGLPHRHLDPPAPTTLEEIGGTVPVTDGECEPFEYARTLEIHRALSEQFDVSINGSFGEVARGYWWELLAPRTGSCRSLPAGRLARKRYAYARFDSSLFRPEDRLDLGDHMTSVVERAVEGLAGYPNTFQMDHAYLALRMQRWQGRIATSTNRLWPCLSPFLFRSVLETMLRTESRLRKRSLLARLLIQKLQPRLAAYPLESGVPAEPLRLRNAHRFGPLAAHYGRRAAEKLFQRRRAAPAGSRPSADRWLRDDERVRSFLDPGEARIGEILDRSALRRFLDASRGDGFAFDEQWRRLLGVECALRLVEKEGAAGGPKSMARG